MSERDRKRERKREREREEEAKERRRERIESKNGVLPIISETLIDRGRCSRHGQRNLICSNEKCEGLALAITEIRNVASLRNNIGPSIEPGAIVFR